ncbi:MAG: TA0938 family protein [Candidatus Hodarchaeales archaeon]
MKLNNTGCALCDSTWGNYYRNIEEENLFFCCKVCADIFEDLIKEVRKVKEIKKINKMEIRGDIRVRNFIVYTNEKKIQGKVTLNRGIIREIIFH